MALSPYYGFQTAGVGVLISWFLTALLSLIIGLAFAEVASILPIVGGVMRFIGVTHSRALGFLFVVLGWVGYVVYLPLEAQSAIQYLGFWVPALVQQTDKGVSLSMMGLIAAFAVMLFLTWFNTQHLTRVAKLIQLLVFGNCYSFIHCNWDDYCFWKPISYHKQS